MSGEIDTKPNDSYAQLLDRLAVGATRRLFSVSNWAAQLGKDPSAALFIEQLAREWYPATAPNPFCQRVAQRCRDHMAEWHSGWPNLWAHSLRVVGYAVHIAPEAGVRAEVAYALGVLHDVGKLDELRTNEAH